MTLAVNDLLKVHTLVFQLLRLSFDLLSLATLPSKRQ